MISQIAIEKKIIQDHVVANVENLLMPSLKKLRRKASEIEAAELALLESNLKQIISPFGSSLSHKMSRLTPREMEICNMIREGLTTKDIAKLLKVAPSTVQTQRNRLRKKMGLVRKKVNLIAHLQSL
jgi:DNA-binding CsgD family transcriptional regulator